MKKSFFAASLVFISALCFAQTEGISYQAVIIDNKIQEIPGINISNNYLIEEEVDLRFTIFDANDAIEYQEINRSVTDRFGLVNVVIGHGIVTSESPGLFDKIKWDGSRKQLQVEVSFRGSEYFMFGKQDLLFVPYGYHRDIYAAGTLSVEGTTTIHDTLIVSGQNPTYLGGDLFVGGVANFQGNSNFQTITVHDWSLLKGTLDVGEATNINGSFSVNESNPTTLSGTLQVNGVTTLNSPLFVQNQSPVLLSGTLDVSNSTTLSDSLSVMNESPVLLSGTLQVNGAFKLYDSLSVLDESPAYFSGTLEVDLSAHLNDSLLVLNQSPTSLTGSLRVNGVTNLFDSLTVHNHSPSHFTGTLEVDQSTRLSDSLFVLNQSPTLLSGSLSVNGVSNLFDSLTVHNESPSYFTGTLTVDQSTRLSDSLSVLNASPTMLTGSLTVDGVSVLNNSLTVQGNSSLNGRVTITASLTGGETATGAYPLLVQGSSQGIAIKVNNNLPDNGNNFITFFNGANEAVGRIEGETTAEKLISFQYIYETAKLATETAIAAADLVAASTSSTVCAGVGACVTAPVPSLIIAAIAKTAIAATNLVAYEVYALCCIGVTYESGSADYAEWLERAVQEERMTYGDIVSVKGGKITKNTSFGDQMMVISYKPAVLGNMPPQDEAHKYEMVAFLGQVPVKIMGKAKIGDYILPSGYNDGFGRAVDPAEMKIEDYAKIVGVAWSASDDEISSYINVAIGMNRNDVAKIIKEQQSEIDELKSRLDQTDALLSELVPGYAERISANRKGVPSESTAIAAGREKALSAEEMHTPIDRAMFEAGFEEAKALLKSNGIDVDTHPYYSTIFSDPLLKNKVIEEAMKVYELQRKRAIEIDKNAGN